MLLTTRMLLLRRYQAWQTAAGLVKRALVLKGVMQMSPEKMLKHAVALEAAPTYRFWTQDTLRFSDTDAIGHINNVAYAAYCETGRVAFNHAHVLSARPEGTSMMVVSLMLHYIAETHFPGMIDIGVGVLAIGRTSYTLGQGLFKDGVCRATAQATLVLVDHKSRKPTPIPDTMRVALSKALLVS
jgi:acyl-CoA thioester hydrolase